VSDVNDEIILELARLYRVVEQRLRAQQMGDLFDGLESI